MITRMMINTQQEKIEHFNFCFCNLTRRKLRLKNTTTVPSNGILNYMVLATAKNKQHEYDVIFIPSPARLWDNLRRSPQELDAGDCDAFEELLRRRLPAPPFRSSPRRCTLHPRWNLYIIQFLYLRLFFSFYNFFSLFFFSFVTFFRSSGKVLPRT